MYKLINIKYLILVYFIANISYLNAQDVSVSINTKKSLHIVDNRFISVVIDPLILMSGLNISLQTMNLAKHFSPAFVRIQGFSTPQISYSNEYEKGNNKNELNRMKLTVTSSMWTSLNEWLINTNLTPVFALSDRDRVNDAWNPKSAALPLMQIVDKMNMTCFWELNNDIPNKSLKQYANDITSLRHILDAFPASRNLWNIVGGELGQYPLAPLPIEGAEIARKLLNTIETTVDAVVWTPILNNNNEYPAKVVNNITPHSKTGPSIWTVAPRSSDPTSFTDALIWAKYLGDASYRGYDAIFRQPKVKELFELTPAYWVSLFHKTYMGRNVLDTRSIRYSNKNNVHIYAHCTKVLNKNTNKGGVTLFIVNMENEDVNITTKFLGLNMKDLEVQSYVLTSPDENSSNIYLNGEQLTIADLQDKQLELMPKSQPVTTSKSLLLDVPTKSVSFYVIPKANLHACIQNEKDYQPLPINTLERFEETTSEPDYDENAQSISNWDIITKIIENEVLSNEEYVKNPAQLRNLLGKQLNDLNNKMNDFEVNTLSDDVKSIILEKAKQKKAKEMQIKSANLKNMLLEHARNEQNRAKLLNEMENFKVHEVQDAINNLIDTTTENIPQRRKRELITSNEIIEDFFMQNQDNEKEILARKARNNLKSLDALIALDPFYNPAQETQCSCSKISKCNCGINATNDLIHQVLGKMHEDFNIKDEKQIGSSEETFKFRKSNAVKEMKSLIKELKSIVTVMKNITKNSINKKSLKMTPKKEEDNEINKYSNEIKVNIVPKNRFKRSLEPESNRIFKKMGMNNIKQKPLASNEVQKLPLSLKEIKEKENFFKALDSNVDSNTNSRTRIIQNKLLHQQKLEKELISYLDIVQKSKMNLQDELSRTVRSTLDDPLNNIRVKKQMKREIWKPDISKDNSESREIKYSNNNSEETKEFDMYMNEISKEGKNLPNFIKHNEAPTYKIQPKYLRNQLENTVHKTNYKEGKNKIVKSSESSSSEYVHGFANNEVKRTTESTIAPSTSTVDENTTTSDKTSTNKTNTTQQNYYDVTENQSAENEDGSEEGLIDETFKNIFHFLSDVHQKITGFLQYLNL